MACSSNLDSLENFVTENNIDSSKITFKYFDATDFTSHPQFYNELLIKLNILIFAAGFW